MRGVVYAVLIVGLLVPALVAYQRKGPAMWAAIIVDVLLGWTIIGWVIALLLAYRVDPKSLSER